MSFICLDDYEKSAATKLPKEQFEYYRSGAFDELTLRQNRTAFDRYVKMCFIILLYNLTFLQNPDHSKSPSRC